MPKATKKILSTRTLDDVQIQSAQAAGIVVDAFDFISTTYLHSPALQQAVANAFVQDAVFVFTSSNAVEATAALCANTDVQMVMACVGGHTAAAAQQYFPNGILLHTADNAAALAAMLIDAIPQKLVVFFCGNRRRDTLPAQLLAHDIAVQEIIVYQTQIINHKAGQYDGILFFSPSGAESYFATNQIESHTILFAIGQTTAAALRQLSNNPIMVSPSPDRNILLSLALSHLLQTN